MLKRILGDLAKVEGVNAAAIVGRDGFVIEHVANIQVDMDALGAMASTSVGTSEAMGIELGKGNFEQVMVELEKADHALRDKPERDPCHRGGARRQHRPHQVRGEEE